MKLNQKNKFLIFGFTVAIFICYYFAITNTINYYKEYHSKNTILNNDNNNAPKLANQLYIKEKQLDLVLSQYKVTTSESFQNYLLKQVNGYSNIYHLKIIDFKEPHSISEKELTITSYFFSLEGSFNDCLTLLNKIENNHALGSFKHLNFTKKINYKTNVDQLFVEMIIQRNTNF